MNRVSSLNYFSKKNTIDLNFLRKELVKTEMAATIFVEKTKCFSLKRRLNKNGFENDLGTFFLPVNEAENLFIYLFILLAS